MQGTREAGTIPADGRRPVNVKELAEKMNGGVEAELEGDLFRVILKI